MGVFKNHRRSASVALVAIGGTLGAFGIARAQPVDRPEVPAVGTVRLYDVSTKKYVTIARGRLEDLQRSRRAELARAGDTRPQIYFFSNGRVLSNSVVETRTTRNEPDGTSTEVVNIAPDAVVDGTERPSG